MKKHSIILLLFIVTSCSFPSYKTLNYADAYLDFTQGKWLLYLNDTKNSIAEKAIQDFAELSSNKIILAHKAKGIIFPTKLDTDFSKKDIEILKQSCDYDYFINIKDYTIKKELASIDIGKHYSEIPKESIVKITMEVYDLKNERLIFSRTVTGKSSRGKGNQDVYFASDTSILLNGAYNRLIKSIRKKSIK